MPRSSPIAAIAALAGLGLASSCHSGLDGAPREPLHATVLPEPLPLPAFTLRDERNEAFTRESLLGQTSLLFFGFTHCPDICPATLQQLALARKQLREQSAGAPATETVAVPQIVLISVDPERDTPEKLKAYVSYFGEGVVAATGSPEALSELGSALGIWFGREGPGEGRPEDLGEDNYTIAHSTAVLVVGEDAAFRALFSAPHKTEYFVHDLPLLMAAR
jgi:protein SCO1